MSSLKDRAQSGLTQTAATARLSRCGAFRRGVLSIRYGSPGQDAALDVRRRCSHWFCDWDCSGALVGPLYVAIAAASGLSSPSPSRPINLIRKKTAHLAMFKVRASELRPLAQCKAAELVKLIGSTIDGSSFSGLSTRPEIGHMRNG